MTTDHNLFPHQVAGLYVVSARRKIGAAKALLDDRVRIALAHHLPVAEQQAILSAITDANNAINEALLRSVDDKGYLPL